MSKYEVLTTREQIKEWFATCKPMVSFDTETDSLRYTELKIHSIQLFDGKKACYIKLDGDKDLIQAVAVGFQNKLKTLIAHNIAFDGMVLRKYGIPFEHCKLYDTMVAAHLLDENGPKALKQIMREKYGIQAEDYDSDMEVHSKAFMEYSVKDVLYTWNLCMDQQEPMKEQGLVALFREIEMPYQLCLIDMKVVGMLVDVQRLGVIEKQLKEKIEELTQEMLHYLHVDYHIQLDLNGDILAVTSPINFSSPKHLQDILFKKLNLRPIEQTPGGEDSVGKLTLHKYKEHPFVRLLLLYKMATKLYNSYATRDAQILKNIEKDGRVRPSFHDCGTRTGRLSCSSPNLQQLPKSNEALGIEVRQCFIAPPGYKMIASDYSGQELRILAKVANEPSMIDAFSKGKDFHLTTAKDFFNLPIEEDELYESHPNYEEVKKKYDKERNQSKIINFGIAYGKGAFGFAKDFSISEQEAQEILDKYFGALPNVKKAIDETHEKLRREGYAQTMAGRRRRFTPMENSSGFKYYSGSSNRESFNFLIQGFAADMIRMASNKVREEAQEYPEWDLKQVASVHDENVYIVKADYAPKALKLIKRCFESILDWEFPIVADAKIGDNYGEVK